MKETPELERAVLGAMLLNHPFAAAACSLLRETMFTVEAHRLVFRAMKAVLDGGQWIDPIALLDRLTEQGVDRKTVHAELLSGLMDAVPRG